MRLTEQIRKNAKQILKENAGERDVKDYALTEADNDPAFFQWLFPHATNIGDFGVNMTMWQIVNAEKFIRNL